VREIKPKLITAIFGIIGLLVFFILASKMDLTLVKASLIEIGIIPVAISLFLVHIGYILYSLAWYLFLEGGISFLDVYLSIWAGVFIHYIIPAGLLSMDTFRIYVANKRGIDVPKAALSVALHRITMLFPFILSVFLGMFYLFISGLELSSAGLKAVAITVVTAFLIIFAFYVSTNEKVLINIISIIGRLAKRDLTKEKRMAEQYIDGFKLLKSDKRLMATALILSFGSWFFDIMPIFILFHALGRDIPFMLGALIYSLNIIMLRLSFGIPGNVGFREWISVEILKTFGIPSELAFAITLIMADVIIFANQLVFGFVAYMMALRRIHQVKGEGNSRRELSEGF